MDKSLSQIPVHLGRGTLWCVSTHRPSISHQLQNTTVVFKQRCEKRYFNPKANFGLQILSMHFSDEGETGRERAAGDVPASTSQTRHSRGHGQLGGGPWAGAGPKLDLSGVTWLRLSLASARSLTQVEAAPGSGKAGRFLACSREVFLVSDVSAFIFPLNQQARGKANSLKRDLRLCFDGFSFLGFCCFFFFPGN